MAAQCFESGSIETWYKMTLDGKRLGFVCEHMEARRLERQVLLTFDYFAVCKVLHNGQTLNSIISKQYVVDSNTLGVTSFRISRKGGGSDLLVEGTCKDGNIHVVTPSGELQFQLADPKAPFIPEHLARLVLINKGLRHGRRLSYTDLDAQGNRPVQKDLVLQQTARTGDAGCQEPWTLTSRDAYSDSASFTMHLDEQANLINARGENQRVLLVRATSEDATRDAPVMNISADSAITAAEPILLPRKVTSLTARILMPRAAIDPRYLTAAPSRLDNAPTSIVITTNEPVDEPLREVPEPTPYVESDDAQVALTARQLTANITDPAKKCTRLMEWCATKVTGGEAMTSLRSAKATFETGNGDCTERAFLFAALAHNVGIPTQLCLGIVYSNGAFHYHAWNKAQIGRQWIGVDCGFGQFSVDGTHIVLWQGGYSVHEIAEMMINLEMAHGRTSVDIIKYVYSEDDACVPLPLSRKNEDMFVLPFH